MPAIIAHHLFGTEVYAELAPLIGMSDAERNAFLLGNIGPDPLFCLKAFPRSTPYRDLGSTMHKKKTAELLAALHRHLVFPDDNMEHSSATTAFALGFLCHYLLDSKAHPLVYAQQFALCNAGVEGLTEKDDGNVHALIETELDEYVLTTHLGITVNEFVPHRETLKSAKAELDAISAAMANAVQETYEMPTPPQTFATSVRLYRAAQVALDSKRDGLRTRFDYARLTNRRYLHVLLLTHSATLRHDTPFANNDHFPWPHPFEEDAIVNASFDELYAAAFNEALEILPRYARDDFSAADCAMFTQGVNFSGKRVES